MIDEKKSVFEIIKKKFFLNKEQRELTKEESDLIDKKLKEFLIEKKELLNLNFDIEGYKHLFLNDCCRKGFTNRLLYSYTESFSEFNIFNEKILSLANSFIKDEKKQNTKTFNVLAIIFIKCNLLVKEIEYLLKNGFPNGALARYRTLFEYSVISEFIAITG